MTKEEAKEMLTNTKVYVNGKSKEIQEKLFEIGIIWSSGCKNVKNTDSPFMFVDDNSCFEIDSDMNFFKECPYKEISADDILNIKIDEEFKLKDGDIFYSTDPGGKHWISILYRIENCKIYTCADLLLETMNLYYDGISLFGDLDDTFNVRLSTGEEKSKLFSALKAKGYVWNEKTKEIENIKKEHKFKPFDRVLVRDFVEDNWDINLFQEIVGENIDYQFVCLSGCFNFCVPYEGNEELLGTSNSPEE